MITPENARIGHETTVAEQASPSHLRPAPVARSQSNPGKYTPAFGGFCSWGISHEIIWNPGNLGPQADPNFWLIHDDRLFLFRR